jgi:hypothetical protein
MPVNKNISQTITQAYSFARRMAPKRVSSIAANKEPPREYNNKLILLDRALLKTDFARPIMLDVTTIAVGAPGCKDVDGNKIGAIYFYRGGVYENIDKNWKKKYKFFYPLTGNEDRLPLDGSSVDFGFSISLSASGTVIAIGAPGERSETGERTGAVYVYSVSENFNSHTLMAKILPPDPTEYKEFGRSVALSDDGSLLFVCDKKINNLSKIYTFTSSSDNLSSWFFAGKRNTRNELATHYNYETKVLKIDKTLPERIAYMDSTGGSTPFVFMCKENVDVLTMTQSTEVVFCTKNKIDRELKIKATLEDPNSSVLSDCFGHSICASPPYLYRVGVGAPGKDNQTGCLYVYIYDGKQFPLFNVLVPDDAEEGDKFGFSCSSSSEQESVPCHLYAIADTISSVGPFEKTSGWSSSYVSRSKR